MKIDISEKWLPVYEALDSSVRIKIINLLSELPLNIKEIASKLELSSAIITMHINKLEKAGIVKGERTKSKGGVQKICSLILDGIIIDFPRKTQKRVEHHEYIVPVGQYTDFEITPTCGLATTEKIIGYFDDTRSFLDSQRVAAKILWFTQGFIEYKLPNYLLTTQNPSELEISMEIGSEAPGANKNWPSDISFIMNGIKIGEWTSPGDFADVKGKYTPNWWNSDINQYGMLKIIKINEKGSFIDGEKISGVKLSDINIRSKQWKLRLEVAADAKHIGGLTVFGSGFGNYDQDLIFRLYYT
ncbi:ArsR family transcriptional regulator [Clostridium estertheticum]|uniref:ArsR/SmtB family transcription factor n=1 Tax=Clostridium estertheticum TaxID=238834 RepID=UPI001CF58F4F|nr:ArsR family transcriptional regulator [Clostridium estertheticum]MCB2305927.1 ArsR family transcriptional regulator [Clostridium estertheticum]MCB2345604.1 ArsR family transcriptional regulator [Clostridium estertheticum]MCB2349101.1 ArsR family transcriptional regulator [Clostridium estertheticum]WAG47738.1 ArsR family transcriptional regulator [Clostridium estertheticum]